MTSGVLNGLFEAAWQQHQEIDFKKILNRSLCYICAFVEGELLGFVNVAWDGGIHGFILDTTVHPKAQRRGMGIELVKKAISTAQESGIEWLHVDYEPHLEGFYHRCGFRVTGAGLMNLK